MRAIRGGGGGGGRGAAGGDHSSALLAAHPAVGRHRVLVLLLLCRWRLVLRVWLLLVRLLLLLLLELWVLLVRVAGQVGQVSVGQAVVHVRVHPQRVHGVQGIAAGQVLLVVPHLRLRGLLHHGVLLLQHQSGGIAGVQHCGVLLLDLAGVSVDRSLGLGRGIHAVQVGVHHSVLGADDRRLLLLLLLRVAGGAGIGGSNRGTVARWGNGGHGGGGVVRVHGVAFVVGVRRRVAAGVQWSARVSRGRARGDAILRRTGAEEMRVRIELLLLRLLLLLLLLHHLVVAGGRRCQLRLLLRIVVAGGAALVAVVGVRQL